MSLRLSKQLRGQPQLAQMVLAAHTPPRAASRADWTAGKSNETNTARIVITTSNSTKVNPPWRMVLRCHRCAPASDGCVATSDYTCADRDEPTAVGKVQESPAPIRARQMPH